mgnify:CR=1 FL=1
MFVVLKQVGVELYFVEEVHGRPTWSALLHEAKVFSVKLTPGVNANGTHGAIDCSVNPSLPTQVRHPCEIQPVPLELK